MSPYKLPTWYTLPTWNKFHGQELFTFNESFMHVFVQLEDGFYY